MKEHSAKESIARRFDRVAATYGRVGPRFFAHFGRRLVELAQIPAGADVLDVATGRGAILYPAAGRVGPRGRRCTEGRGRRRFPSRMTSPASNGWWSWRGPEGRLARRPSSPGWGVGR